MAPRLRSTTLALLLVVLCAACGGDAPFGIGGSDPVLAIVSGDDQEAVNEPDDAESARELLAEALEAAD